MVASSRTVFQASNEADIVRKIAVQMSYLPAGVRLASDSDGGLAIAPGQECGWLLSWDADTFSEERSENQICRSV